MGTIVVAVDSFKGSATAASVAAALADGCRRADPAVEVVERPLADGGEGTLAAVETCIPGATRVPVTVTGPDDTAVEASWLLLPDGGGVVELASTSGIELLHGRLRPWEAHTVGFGQAIAAALDRGVHRLVLGIGSSASTDAGLGMLTALGARVQDADGEPVPTGARGLGRVRTIDLHGMRPLPSGGVTVLADVRNPLCGPRGAAAVFGPQKGFDVEETAVVDERLERIAALLRVDADGPGTGAAGGVGAALRAWGGASGAPLVSGAAYLAEVVRLDEAVAGADLVITGEGAYDASSRDGKVPRTVHRVAAAHGVPVALVAGRIDADADTSPFAASVSLTALAGSSSAALADPLRWLREAGRRLARTV